MPRLSVVTPSYNHYRFLADRVRSIAEQTFSDFEWIVIDDCSTDPSDTFWREVAASDQRVRYIRNSCNLGMRRTVTTAISLASGAYVYRAESDDFCEPTLFARMVEVLDRFPNVGLVYGKCLHMDTEGRTFGGWRQGSTDLITPSHQVFYDLLKNNFISGGNIMFRRTVHDEVGGFAVAPFEIACDYHFALRVSLSHDIGYIATPNAYHRAHGGNLSSRLSSPIDIARFFTETFELLLDVLQLAEARFEHKNVASLRFRALRNQALKVAAPLHAKLMYEGRAESALQLQEGVEHYLPGLTRSREWAVAACYSFILSAAYQSYDAIRRHFRMWPRRLAM